MSILEQLKESLSPERIGTRPYILCVFLQDIVCGLFVFFFFAWANWITTFSLLSYAFHSFLLLFYFLFFFTTLLRCRSGAVLRVVHRKTLLEAVAEELPINTIRFSSKLTSIRTQGQEGSSIALIDMEDGTTIRAKVTCH